MPLHHFGIRHHGPGCARALVAALDELRPTVVVLEAPTDADAVIRQAADEGMQPPVAMLIYPPDAPQEAAYYPMLEHSPEWQAIRWAEANEAELVLMDEPLAMRPTESEPSGNDTEQSGSEPTEPSSDAEEGEESHEQIDAEENDAEEETPGDDAGELRHDPLAELSRAAGYDDPELWWETQIERRTETTGLFEAIAVAMTALREARPDERPETLSREAHMRRTLRGVVKQSPDAEVAVVCGAWHVPALSAQAVAGKVDGCRIKDDSARLKGRTKRKTAATWIPWTADRMSQASGYGAGVVSPGWYEHLWAHPEDAAIRWLVRAARLLRGEDLDASSASVIESIRLADALAAMRDLRGPGLSELREAIRTVLCHGQSLPLEVIRLKLEVGSRLGAVPDDTPTVPLQQDLARTQKSLRLKPAVAAKTVDLDLRTDSGRARSQLLHRLSLLEIPWGQLLQSGSQTSTFRESWELAWKPEFAVRVIEANVYGSTVEAAAAGRTLHEADRPEHAAERLVVLSALLDQALLAGLPEVLDGLLRRIDEAATRSHSVRQLLDALEPLARVCRYGDVRGTRAADVEPVLETLFERAAASLATAAYGLDEEAAERFLESLQRGGTAIALLARDDLLDRWKAAVRTLPEAAVPPVVRGRAVRLLLDLGDLGDDELDRLARLALSTVNPPEDAAAWATGLLRGSGLVLLHRTAVWGTFDRWLRSLDVETFLAMLPLLRRAFADFSNPEREKMGRVVKELSAEPASAEAADAGPLPGPPIDAARAEKVLPVLEAILSAVGQPGEGGNA